PDPSTFAGALAVLEQYHLLGRTSPAVRTYLQAGAAGQHPETPKPGDPLFQRVQYSIIGNNYAAVAAAAEEARRQGFHAAPMSNFIQGEARLVAHKIASLADSLSHNVGLLQRPIAIVMGGETTVTIRGNGLGGRNQELALAIALEIRNYPDLLIACFATDGNDGPTDAAGAFVDGQTVARAAALGLDAQVYLDNNNSYPFFQALDDLILTGPTNTNVNDLILLLAR
ncbi:MAG: glycerate kinase, partial [Caldilineae bacterium]